MKQERVCMCAHFAHVLGKNQRNPLTVGELEEVEL